MKTFFPLLLFSGIVVYANAQIVYTDVKPDKTFSCITVGCSQHYNLDLNKDGVNDFLLKTTKSYASCGSRYYLTVGVFTLDSNEVVSSGSSAYNLLADAIIDDRNMHNSTDSFFYLKQLNWIRFPTISGGWVCRYVAGGYWPNGNVFSTFVASSDGYLGLKLKKGSDIYYGWARLKDSLVKDTSASFTIRDYAYNTIPNQPILAGETSCTGPTATLKANGPLNFCAGDSVILNAKGTGYLYQWKKNGTNISGATSARYIAKTAGTYKCEVTNSCGSIISAGVKVTVSCLQSNLAIIDEKLISKATQLKVSPNPFSNTTTISFSLAQSQKVSISIFNGTGGLIKVLADVQMQAGTHQLVWNAKDEKGNAVSAGIYFLKMETGNYVKTKKLIVVR